MKLLYETIVTNKGDRKSANAQSNDGVLNIEMSSPKELGGDGKHTNPEQLFAAGYGACFASAIRHVATSKQVTLTDIQVDVKVGLYKNDDGDFQLSANLSVTLPGVEKQVAEDIVHTAHNVCPYSRATRGNVEVELEVL